MSLWTERILSHFTADLTRQWVACDPDDVLLDEKLLTELRDRGFELMLYEDPFAFRAEYEERYRALAENLKNSKVFAREEQQVWQCRNCGYTYIGKSAPLKCPVCAHPQSYFELKKINY